MRETGKRELVGRIWVGGFDKLTTSLVSFSLAIAAPHRYLALALTSNAAASHGQDSLRRCIVDVRPFFGLSITGKTLTASKPLER